MNLFRVNSNPVFQFFLWINRIYIVHYFLSYLEFKRQNFPWDFSENHRTAKSWKKTSHSREWLIYYKSEAQFPRRLMVTLSEKLGCFDERNSLSLRSVNAVPDTHFISFYCCYEKFHWIKKLCFLAVVNRCCFSNYVSCFFNRLKSFILVVR